MSTTAATPDQQTTRSTTGYVVLQIGGDGAFRVVNMNVQASDAELAVREVAERNLEAQQEADMEKRAEGVDVTRFGGKHATFVAIPALLWHPITVKAETKTVLTLT